MPRGIGPDTAGQRSGGALGKGSGASRPASIVAATARKRGARTPATPAAPARSADEATVDVEDGTVDLREPRGTDAGPGPTGSTGPATVDGRTARAERTRTTIVDALLSLLEEGDLLPTAHRVAERAGVSLRLIYHHFGDLESLFQAVSQRQYERMEDLLVTIAPDLPLDQRIDELVLKRVGIYERMASVRRASMLQEPFSPTLIATRDSMVEVGRRELEDLFATELAPRSRDDQRIVVAALFAALSWHAWNALDLAGTSHDDVVGALDLLVRGALSAPS